MVDDTGFKTVREIEGGLVTIKEISSGLYGRLSSIRSREFSPSQYGMFGVEDELLILQNNDWCPSGNLELLATRLQKRFEEIRKKRNISSEIEFEDVGDSLLEIRRGVFQRPMEEFILDKIIKEEIEKITYKMGLRPVYTGKINIPYLESFSSQDFHFSAGNPLNSILFHDGMRNDLWRIVAFSANSPTFDRNGRIELMNSRFGKSYVKILVPQFCIVSKEKLNYIFKHGFSTKRYPLKINQRFGTNEVRASDLDPRSAADVAYTLLLSYSICEKLSEEVVIYDRDIIKKNIESAKKYAISDKGEVEVLLDGEIVKRPIKQEMIRHYKEVIVPLMERKIFEYGKQGMEFIHQCVIDEIEDRINGNTPGKRYIKKLRTLLSSLPQEEALLRAHEVNLFNQRNYFKI